MEMQEQDRKNTLKQFVQVHAAADKARNAYGPVWQSERKPRHYQVKKSAAAGPSFVQDSPNLINEYTHKVDLQEKYQTGFDAQLDGDEDSDGESESRLSFTGQRRTMSEFDVTRRQVHSHNLLDLFYEQASVDSFIAENLYGGYGDNLPDHAARYAGLKYFDIEQMTYLAPAGPNSKQQASASNEQKLSPFECYIALVKGYCVILVLVLPRSFATGGYACTAALVLASGVVSTFCASLLVQAGLQANIHSYPLLTEKVLGPRWKVAADLIIALAQFSFTVSHISFIIQSIKTTVDA